MDQTLAFVPFAALIALASACSEPIDDDPVDDVDPDQVFAERQQLGTFAVGYRQADITYRPAATDADRTVPVEIWYPAEPGGPEAGYAVAGLVSLTSPNATSGDLASSDTPFPVAVYSHGNGGLGLVGYPIGEYLASYGWVVIAPDHTGNTALDFLFDTADNFVQAALNRPQDISASLDWLEGLDDDPLAGQTDTAATLMIGHSFGGYTTFAVGGAKLSADPQDVGCPDPDNPLCDVLEDPEVQTLLDDGFGDPRIAALVPQAPAISLFDPSELTAVTLPTMLQSGGLDATTTPEASSIPTWDALDGDDDVWIDMPTGGHVTFLSICDDLDDALIQTLQPGADEDGCGPAFIPVSEALPVLNAYIGLFGATHVLGEPFGDVLEAAVPPTGFVLTAN